MRKKLGAILLSLTLLLALAAGCTAKPAPSPTPTGSVNPAPSGTPSLDGRAEVRLAMLNGPTGMGAAKLMADNDAGTTLNRYAVEVAVQPNDVGSKLINGDLDIAALPTNVAATLYQKTQGGVKLLALNTLGVLYILENGESVQNMADLKGKTLYATGQGANPEYILNYLLKDSGLDPAKDLDIQWKTGEEVTALMASGEAELALLPVPAATTVMMKNENVREAIDLNDIWTQSVAAGSFTMGCVVVRTGFLEDNTQAVEDFLTEYAASIDYVKSNVEAAADLVAQYGITPSAEVAKAAIPQANLVCITGNNMLAIQDYFEVLFQANPDSIGGSIPDGAFFYGAG